MGDLVADDSEDIKADSEMSSKAQAIKEMHNVISIERARHDEQRAETEQAARQYLPQERVFQPVPLSEDAVQYLQKGDMLIMDPPVNKALRLAQSENFLEMCLPILWGDEKRVHFQRFGMLLRGAVETFKPLSMMELALVKNVVAAQWRLDRLYQTQTNVYHNEARAGEIGKYGLPAASHSAMELDEQIYRAQQALKVAIDVYQKTIRTSLMANKDR